MISRVAHDGSRNVLYVEFNAKGGVTNHYEYLGVTTQAMRAMVDAPSVGKHFIENIRDAHAYQRLDAQEFERHFERLSVKFEINWDRLVALIEFS